MSRVINKLLSTTGGVAAETDEFFNQTTLLLHGDGTNGSQNNTFLDSSANSFTITRNGNTTQGSYSPYGDRWSNYFDGTGDYLSAANNETAAGNFTLEFWYNSTQVPLVTPNPRLFSSKGSGANADDNLQITIRTDSDPSFPEGTLSVFNNNYIASNDVSTSDGNWHHVAVSRDGTTLRFFIDGVLVDSATTSQSFTFVDSLVGVRGDLAANSYYDGYLSDVRFVNGTALYTSSFTPPTEPLTAVTGTSLLTCQSNRFIDNSSNGFAITVNGDTKVTPFSPYAPSDAYDPANEGGSGYFDGTGDYLDFGSIDIATSQDFCAEAWVYLTAYDNAFTEVFAGPSVATANQDNTQFRVSSTGDIVFAIGGQVPVNVANAWPGLNQWVHVAFVRNSNVCDVYINGQSIGSGTQSAAGRLRYIGETFNGSTPQGYYINGYVSDARIVIGSPVYTSNFTPPTAPLPVVANTSFLCNFDNAGIFDSTGKNVIETVGNAQIDTTVVKYGTGAMEFDGSDYLLIPSSDELKLGGGDFTIEGWIYFNASGDWCVTSRAAADGLDRLTLVGNNNRWVLQTLLVNHFIISWTPTVGQWYHFACVRSGNTATMYINGSSIGSGTFNGVTESSTPMYIGRNINGDEYLNGYIDDLRITKGVARYTANFTPPTKAFPDQ